MKTEICINPCWCGYCSSCIKKGERYLKITANAWKGTTRTNICRKCLIKMFIELGIKEKELKEIKNELTLETLEKGNGENEKSKN